MKLLTMTEWADIVDIHHPIFVMGVGAALGYFKSSISEHYWRPIPAYWSIVDYDSMWESTKFEDMGGSLPQV